MLPRQDDIPVTDTFETKSTVVPVQPALEAGFFSPGIETLFSFIFDYLHYWEISRISRVNQRFRFFVFQSTLGVASLRRSRFLKINQSPLLPPVPEKAINNGLESKEVTDLADSQEVIKFIWDEESIQRAIFFLKDFESEKNSLIASAKSLNILNSNRSFSVATLFPSLLIVLVITVITYPISILIIFLAVSLVHWLEHLREKFIPFSQEVEFKARTKQFKSYMEKVNSIPVPIAESLSISNFQKLSANMIFDEHSILACTSKVVQQKLTFFSALQAERAELISKNAESRCAVSLFPALPSDSPY